MRENEQLWTQEESRRLGELWALGTPSRDIAALMNRPKDSIVGKVRRLGLTARPSPIVRKEISPGVFAVPKISYRQQAAISRAKALQASGSFEVKAPDPVIAPREVVIPPASSCQFPLWPHSNKNPVGRRYCDAPSKPGYSYCTDHTAVCFVRPDQRPPSTFVPRPQTNGILFMARL